MFVFGLDWELTFSKVFAHLADPYVIRDFTNPPWAAVLLPHGLLGGGVGLWINLALNFLLIALLVRKSGGGYLGLALVMTNPASISLFSANNLEWMIALAFLVPAQWGMPLLLVKPQVALGAAAVWWKRQRFSLGFFAPLVVVLLLSFLVWGWWPARLNGLPADTSRWNFAPWPMLIPVGLGLVLYGMFLDDEALAAVGTPFLTPYVASYSLPPLLALLSGRHLKAVFWLWVGLWAFAIVEARRMHIALF